MRYKFNLEDAAMYFIVLFALILMQSILFMILSIILSKTFAIITMILITILACLFGIERRKEKNDEIT